MGEATRNIQWRKIGTFYLDINGDKKPDKIEVTVSEIQKEVFNGKVWRHISTSTGDVYINTGTLEQPVYTNIKQLNKLTVKYTKPFTRMAVYRKGMSLRDPGGFDKITSFEASGGGIFEIDPPRTIYETSIELSICTRMKRTSNCQRINSLRIFFNIQGKGQNMRVTGPIFVSNQR